MSGVLKDAKVGTLYLKAKNLQQILEKFEFFPIKCRVQRSLDIFKIAQENIATHDKKIRLKVQ